MKILNYVQKHLNFNLGVFKMSFLTFPLLVVFGTLTHELGHIIVAELLGFETILHYGSMEWFSNGVSGNLVENKFNNLLVASGGPLQTIFTGMFGLYLISNSTTKTQKWVGIFIGLFWSRQVINLLMGLINGFFYNKNYFGGDELFISELLNLPSGFFSILLGVIGFFICFYIVSKIDIKDRFSFLTAGLISGCLSYVLWFGYIGKFLLP